jgi:membrane fusion protein, multidrug efflux system
MYAAFPDLRTWLLFMPNYVPLRSTKPLWIGLAALLILIGGYFLFFSNGNSNAPADMQAAEVEVITVEPVTKIRWTEFPGRLVAIERVQVKPQVSGTIVKILFTEGAMVEAGDPLFLIDPRPYEAAVKAAGAALKIAESEARLAKLELERAQPLVKKQVISKAIFDDRRNNYEVANASVEAAKAALATARLNLEYANVSAPVSGQVSRAEVTLGNLVEAGAAAPVLTSIVAVDKVYAEFDVDENTYVSTVRNKQTDVTTIPVELRITSNPEVKYTGSMQSFDNRIDLSSGTIRARAVIENHDGALTEGMYADIRLGSPSKQQTILIPELAVSTDQDRKFVYVVDASGKAQYRAVILGNADNGQRVVLDGLKPGERVIVNGLQRVRPDAPVTITAPKQTDKKTARSTQEQAG